RPVALSVDPAGPRVLLVCASRVRGDAMSLPFTEWLSRQRWYAGGNREPARVVPLADDLDLMLVDAAYTVGPAERYQVIVRWDTAPPEEYTAVATIGSDDGRTGY